MYCSNCGRMISNDGVNFCPMCGADFRQLKNVEDSYVESIRNNAIEKKNKTRKMVMIALFGMLIVIFLIVASLNDPNDSDDAITEVDTEDYNETTVDDLEEDTNEEYYSDNVEVEMQSQVATQSFYDEFNTSNAYEWALNCQIADMYLYYHMTAKDFFAAMDNSAYHWGGGYFDPEERIPPNKGYRITFYVNGVDTFTASIMNNEDIGAHYEDCLVEDVFINKDAQCSWYNSYGFGAYGENVPDYYSFINYLDSNNVDHYETEKGEEIVVRCKTYNSYSQKEVVDFIYDSSTKECIRTSWDDGQRKLF